MVVGFEECVCAWRQVTGVTNDGEKLSAEIAVPNVRSLPKVPVGVDQTDAGLTRIAVTCMLEFEVFPMTWALGTKESVRAEKKRNDGVYNDRFFGANLNPYD